LVIALVIANGTARRQTAVPRTARDAEFAAPGAQDVAIAVGERTRTGHH